MDIRPCPDEQEFIVADSGEVFSRDQFLKVVADAEEKEKQAVAARQKRDLWLAFVRDVGKEDWIPSSLLIATSGQQAKPPGKKGRAAAERGTWTAEILLAIGEQPEGITPLGLREIMMGGPMADRMKSNINGFYNAIAKLVDSQKAQKYRGHLFTPDLLDAFKERVLKGETTDYPEEIERPASLLELTLALIERHPGGLEVSEIIEMMMAAGHVDNSGSIYNVMSKLNLKGLVRREGKKYFPKENGSPEGGPDTGGNAA